MNSTRNDMHSPYHRQYDNARIFSIGSGLSGCVSANLSKNILNERRALAGQIQSSSSCPARNPSTATGPFPRQMPPFCKGAGLSHITLHRQKSPVSCLEMQVIRCRCPALGSVIEDYITRAVPRHVEHDRETARICAGGCGIRRRL